MKAQLGRRIIGQANVFIISCTHSISSTTPDQESTAIFPIQLIRVQSMPYRTWPVPRARSHHLDGKENLKTKLGSTAEIECSKESIKCRARSERRLSDLQSGHSGPAVFKFFFHRNVTIAEVERLSPCERHRKKTDI